VPPTPPAAREPLTPTQRSVWIGVMSLGVVLAVIGFFFVGSGESGSGVTLPDLLFAGLAAAGGAMVAVGAIMLFHRPDRKPR